MFFLSSCQNNPASGKKEINLMSEKEEQNIGDQEHPKIIKEFGGIYKNEKLQNYIESLGEFLVNTSETPNRKFKFTLLNSPIVNAFALPGGYIYLTRGLLALCQNEAQLAGVIAHEIGHIIARHTARRYTKNIGTSLVANILGSLTNNILVRNLIDTSASLYLFSFSRNQEYEADLLSTRYMIRAGFDPREMANFLEIMENYSDLQKEITRNNSQKTSELLQTHPTSSKRVTEVVKNSSEKIPINPIIGKEIFLKKIDGLVFGDKSQNGFFTRKKFIHRTLGFSFSLNNNFYFLNFPKYLLGLTDNETTIIFDIDEIATQNTIDYMADWAKISKNKIKNFSYKNINGLQASYGIIDSRNKKMMLFVIQGSKFFYRFVLVSNNDEFKKFTKDFARIVNSFKKESQSELETFHEPKIKILTFSDDTDFLDKIISKLNLQTKHSRKIFNTINNLPEKKLIQGEKIKMIY